MKKFAVLFIFLLSLSVSAQNVAPTWESINQRGYPQWFSDAKLGIFIHWGLYSVPSFAGKEGYAEWYYRGIMVQDPGRMAFQNRVYGEGFQYSDFANMFKGELWNPDEWAELFRRSGAKYVLLVTKHHDGYCLWNSKLAPEWNSVTSGPHRDIVGELTNSVRAKGLKMGFYYSLAEWTNPKHIWMVDPDDSIADYVDNYMIPQFKELVSEYKPSLIFTDGEWNNSAEQWHARELISWYYNTVGDEAVVNDRWGDGTQHGFRTPEYSAGITQIDRPWAECRGLGRSFALNRNEPIENYLTSDELIRHFVTLVAAGGGMTLNVGPSADGQIPLLQQERLLDLGKWLNINEEAIFGTRPFNKFFEEREISVSRNDSIINFDWVRNSPDLQISCDNFTAEWNAVFVPEKTAVYTFDVEVDDNVILTIGDNVVIDYNPAKAEAAQSNAAEAKNWMSTQGSVKLKKGVSYPVNVKYEEKNLEALIKLYISSKEIEKSVFKPEKGFDAVYKSMKPYVCYTTKGNDLYAIAIEYPQDNLVLAIDKPSRNAEITMLGCDKILPWRYKDGKVIIDTTPLKYNDLQSTAAWVFKIREFR